MKGLGSTTKSGGILALLSVLGVATLAGLSAPAGAAPTDPAVQAAPTSTPGAPGIVVGSGVSFDLPDPMLVNAGGEYHMYLSTAFGDRSLANIPEVSWTGSRWGPERDALPSVAPWARSAITGGKSWDPYVERINGAWLLYYSPELLHSSPATHCLAVARSVSPDGPFIPVGTQPIVCQQSEGGDIDVQPFFDPAGPGGRTHPWYLVWKSDDNNLRPQHRPTAIWAAPLANDGLSVSGTPTVIFRADQAWERPVLEAPQMVLGPDGRVWMFFSAGKGFETPHYAMGVAVCNGPLGGCHTSGTTPLVATNSQGDGPGEETVFVAPDGSYWLIYNPWHTGLPFELFRPAEGVRIGWSRQGPYVAEAGRFPSPIPPRAPVRPPVHRFR